MITIKNSSIATSAVRKNQYPEPELPEIVLLGRSNAGKSSLINTLINRKNLARTSSAPGKTRLINFYLAEGVIDTLPVQWYFVDLPGYGYAKAAKTERSKWLEFMDEFLRSHRERIYCWQLVDIRHKPSAEDVIMFQTLLDNGYKMQVIANKSDKIGKNARQKQLKLIADTLGIRQSDITVFSAINREGRDELLALAEKYLASFYPAE